MGLFGRPVIDRTGIAGKFDWHLEFVLSNAADDLAGPSIFTAIQEQLGQRVARGPTTREPPRRCGKLTVYLAD
jgi:uncharacterized protein (TIGR03435 family)